MSRTVVIPLRRCVPDRYARHTTGTVESVKRCFVLLVLVAMGGVAVSVFFSSSLPAFGHVRLATLAIVLVALGAATDRILAGVGGAGELLLFLGAAAAVIGAVLFEIGRDQPMGIAR